MYIELDRMFVNGIVWSKMELLYNKYILDILLLCYGNYADVMVKVQHMWRVHLQRQEVQQP